MLPKFSTRQHVAIAKVIKNHNESFPDVIDDHSYTQDFCSCEQMILDIADMFESDNPKGTLSQYGNPIPNFDRVRFIKACGLGIEAPEIIKVS
jgi:hypothetical protein